jgi:hypothetical protein
VTAMLTTAAPGPRAEALLDDYHALRRVESRVRWTMGRGVERLPAEIDLVAELIEEGLEGDALRERVIETRRRIRVAYERVIASGSIAGL